MLPLKLAFVQREQNGPPPGGPPAPPATPPSAPPPATPPAPPPAAPPPASAKALGFEDLPTDWQAEIKKLRNEAAENRVKATTATRTAETTFRELAKSLGVEIPGGDPLDPAKLSEELAKTRRENLDLKVGSALDAAFTKYGAKAKLTRALLRDEGALRDLDPTSAEFQRDLNAIVKKAVDDNPDLKAGQAPAPKPPVGAEFPGGGQPPSQQLTKEHIAVMKPDEVLAAVKAGQFDVLLGRTKTP